jgi:hypothetical protein
LSIDQIRVDGTFDCLIKATHHFNLIGSLLGYNLLTVALLHRTTLFAARSTFHNGCCKLLSWSPNAFANNFKMALFAALWEN